MKWIAGIMLSLLIVTGCSNAEGVEQGNKRNELSKMKTDSRSYLENKGYQIVSYDGRAESYELTKQKIISLPYMMYWGLQLVDPSKYFGKTINVEKFIVKNHPLAKGKVDIYLYEVDGQPIGGTSYPHGDTSDGGYWSIDGKTIEELQPKSYQDWSMEWVNKYSD
ncbi:hypothetical protein [Paenibacillus harenae]|uniref:hypothetical protein n=1 Tax=Paenibacillus harenae TaxID=306543 RepID=UPI0004911196|nr:hypothetical protein [Paenibacillus harenae]